MENNNHIITINDIAQELGISGSTVSRALHDDARISQEVIKKVKKAAARLGYIPNVAARSLRTGKSDTIGLIVRDINDGWSATVIPSLEKECAAKGYGLLLCNSNNDPQLEKFYMRVLQQRRVDGVLILTPIFPAADPYFEYSKSVPLVLVDIGLNQPLVNAITVDHELGAYLSTEYLLGLGHRRIVFLAGPMNLSPNIMNVRGYKRAMTEAGIHSEKQIIVVTTYTGIQDGFDGMLEILKLNPIPTALATFSDLVAAGALDAAKRNGINIPEDFSIIGYDDIPLSSLITPPLTTVIQDKETLGKLSVEVLCSVIQGEDKVPRQYKIPPKLVIRDSTSPYKQK
jgi:LacI family transcriptional regulator